MSVCGDSHGVSCSIRLYSILLLLDVAVLLRLEPSWPLIIFFVSDTLLEAKAKSRTNS